MFCLWICYEMFRDHPPTQDILVKAHWIAVYIIFTEKKKTLIISLYVVNKLEVCVVEWTANVFYQMSLPDTTLEGRLYQTLNAAETITRWIIKLICAIYIWFFLCDTRNWIYYHLSIQSTKNDFCQQNEKKNKETVQRYIVVKIVSKSCMVWHPSWSIFHGGVWTKWGLAKCISWKKWKNQKESA